MKRAFGFFALLWWLGGVPAQGQSLIEMYREARFEQQAHRVFQRYGLRAEPLPPARLPGAADTLWEALAEPEREPVVEEPAFEVTRWRAIRRLERPWFERYFADTRWAFLGKTHLTFVDTTWTRELRGRLEARFGAPTQTIAELDLSDSLAVGDYIQFEYWFVVNDSIPLRVVDVDGPFDRGVVLASDRRYGDVLQDLREALVQELLGIPAPDAYVDYYFDTVEQVWYRTGYDGEQYFLEKIRRPRQGRPLPGGT